MRIKTLKINDKDFKFSNGVNVITGVNSIFFYNLAFFLYKLKNAELDFTADTEIYDNIDACILYNNDKESITFKMLIHEYDILNKEEIENCFNEINNKEKNKSIIFFANENADFSSHYITNFNKHPEYEDDSFLNYNYYSDFCFWIKFYIEATYNNNEYYIHHFNILKQMVNEFLSINHYEDFSFDLTDYNSFTYSSDGIPYSLNNDENCIGKTIGLMMKLYRHALTIDEKNTNAQCSDATGIVVCNYRFGERPSYSDKKWEYYAVFKKYFPNIQFILE